MGFSKGSRSLAAVFFLVMSGAGLAQAQNKPVKDYTSRIDAGLSIKSVVVVPMIDNVNSIYSGPLTEELIQLVTTDRQWNLIPAKDLKSENPDILEENPKRSREILTKYGVDALVSGRILKGDKGVTLKLTLISGQDALPLVNQVLENYQGFETKDLKEKLARLFADMKNRLPYQAVVTSRQGQLVTVNVGRTHGAQEGEDLLPVLITNIERHPKFKFLVRSEREILGKIKLSKVEESISFGSVVSELTANLVQPGMKIARDQFLNYPGVAIGGGKVLTPLDQRKDNAVSFGENPTEWTPLQKGSFGRLGFLAGFNQTTLETSYTTYSASSSNTFSPTVKIEGELWIDPNWQVSLELEQLAAKVGNDSTASPDKLSFQMQRTLGLGAYNFLAEDEFFGPKFQLMVGFGKLTTFIDTSTPRAHTSKDYSAFVFGLGGSLPFPIENRRTVTVGGRFLYHWKPQLSESPSSSGTSADLVSDFSVYGEYGISQRLGLKAELSFKQLSSTFSGTTVNSASTNFVGILAGVSYQF